MFVNCIRIHWPRARRCSPTSSEREGVHCAFSEILTGDGGGRELETRMCRDDYSFLSFFFLFIPSSILGTRHNGWETLWYVTDMNIIHPLFSSSSSSSLCGCYAKRYTHSVVLQLREPQCDRGRYTMTIVNTFQTGMASDTLHDTTIPSCDHRADAYVVNEDRSLFLYA